MGIRTFSRQLLRDGHCSGENEKKGNEKKHNERTHCGARDDGGCLGHCALYVGKGRQRMLFYTHLDRHPSQDTFSEPDRHSECPTSQPTGASRSWVVVPTVEVSTNKMGIMCQHTGSWQLKTLCAMHEETEIRSSKSPITVIRNMPSPR
jgi:hypothetical protein